MTKVVTLSEDDVCTLLQTYSAATILSVLGEIAQYPKVEINWDEIVSNTCSGITSASHLQLLWRHLAYRLPLDNLNNIDYDSDLDLQLQPYPVNPDTDAADTAAAAACVTVLAASSANGVIDLDNPSVPPPPPPLSTQPIVCVDSNTVLRKKRKWTDDEDSKLIASVVKWGEGNWIAISKDSPFARSPAQLSQRWAHIRKRQGSVNLGAATSTAPLLSEAQLATRRAINMALKDNLPPVGNGASVTNNPAKPKLSNGEPPATTISVPAQRQLPHAVNAAALKAVPSSTLPKPRSALKKTPPKPPSISDTIQRTAVAAGARIVNPSDANPVHNHASVRFFRTGALGSTVSVGAGIPKAKTMPDVSSSASAIDSLLKKGEKTSMESNVPCSETKPTVRVQESNASLPQCLPKAQPVNSQSPSLGLTKQTAAVIISSESTISKGYSPTEGKDETLLKSSIEGLNEAN